MSHFTVLVMFDKQPENIDAALAERLVRYDENREVPSYIRETREQSIVKERETIEAYRDGLYAKYLADPAKYRDDSRHNPGHIEYVSREFPLEILPLLDADDDDALFAKASKWDEPGDRDAEGNLWSTYNPDSKWDWWVIGGRWEGEIMPGDMGLVSSLKDRTFAVITPDGEWHERGRMGWFASVTDEKDDWGAQFDALVASNSEAFGVVIDAHI